MSALTLPRPGSDEAAAYYHGYISEVAGENIGDQLLQQITELEQLYSGLDDRTSLARYAPGKWSIKEILGHLIDAERIFTYRLLRIARGDTTPLPGFDQNPYVSAGRFDERPLASLVTEFRAIRLSSVALMDGVPPSAWPAIGQASDNPVSARALAYIIVGHTVHHLAVLRERYGLIPAPGAAPGRRRVHEHEHI